MSKPDGIMIFTGAEGIRVIDIGKKCHVKVLSHELKDGDSSVLRLTKRQDRLQELILGLAEALTVVEQGDNIATAVEMGKPG